MMKKTIRLLVFSYLLTVNLFAQYYDGNLLGTSQDSFRVGNTRYFTFKLDADSNFVEATINGIKKRFADQDWVNARLASVGVDTSKAFNWLGTHTFYNVVKFGTQKGYLQLPTRDTTAAGFIYRTGASDEILAFNPTGSTKDSLETYSHVKSLYEKKLTFSYPFSRAVNTISLLLSSPLGINGSNQLDITSTIGIGDGGTNNISFPIGKYIYYNGTKLVGSQKDSTSFEVPLTFNYPLSRTGNAISFLYNSSHFSVVGNQLTANNITASSTNGMSITSPFTLGSAITINTPQDLRTTASPTFVNETLSGILTQQGTGINTIAGDISQSGNKSFYNNFVSGWTGSGWRLDYGITETGKSYLEIDNLTVRKRMSIYELLIRQIQAVNGNLFVASSAKAISATSTQIVFEDPTGHNVLPFAANDLLVVQRLKLNGDLVNKLVYGEFTVTSVAGMTVTGTWNDPPTAYTDVKGCAFVRVGNTTDATRRSSIYLASDDTYSPYIDIIDGVNSWAAWASSSKIKSRFGKLDGIYDADFGGYLSGYGNYIQNLYAKGIIRITNPSTFNNGNPLNTTDLTNNSNWDNTTDGLNSGVTITGGGITLNTNAVIKSGQTGYQTGTGYWIGVASGTPRLSIGNSSTEYLAWNGSVLAVKGSIYMDDGTITWSAVNEPTKSDLGTWTTYIDANGIYTGTLTADQVNAVNVIADSVMANHWIYSPKIRGGDILIGSGNNVFGADATNGIYLGNATPGSAPFRVSQAGYATMTSANIAGWTIASDKIEKITYDGSKWLYVDLFSTFSSYATGLQVRAEHSSATKVIVNAGSYNDGGAARYGLSIWDAINSQWLLNVGYGGPSNNLSAQIAGFSFDYQKMYAGTATAGISLNKSSTAFITGASAKGFEVYDVSDPKMFIGKKDGDYLDWNVTTANTLTIKGRMISSWISTASAQSGNYTYAALYSSTVRSQKYTDADNYWDARLEDGKINIVNREAGVTNTIIIDKDGLKLNGYRNARWLGSFPGGSIGDGRDGDIIYNTSLGQIGVWAYGAWRWL